MRVFVAGATGAVGRPLIRMLVDEGHDVVGTTGTPANVDAVTDLGATAVVMDGLDPESVRRAVVESRPDVVIHQLTALKAITGNMRKFDADFAVTNRLRAETTDSLLAAARESGVKRFIAQSFTGWTNPKDRTGLATEDEPLDPHPTKHSRNTLAGIAHLEKVVPAEPGMTGIVLRYGFLYGPGTGLNRGGDMSELIREGKFPIVGGGGGVWPMVHVEDAALAAARAVEHGDAGLYNVVDDDPALVRDWLPALAAELGAKPPMRLPRWLGRVVAGEHAVSLMTSMRGSSNAKAKRELGWELKYPSWREGFKHGIG
ncbi:NAD-dependent epimerase/dehydratase family protein [Solicola gregarius]|uniref:NAD(P)-dependent oxidoreductase n=1 Tax=Solicola gregarius TaxID=2908642 RepID=A0AA46YJT9_9ACTN|nr:NAD(P)-dependent oxidoreductase [Solicola gregarius]UYM03851.1 NAD(P)-dependent oxidoreductase [Solicola gregarius]